MQRARHQLLAGAGLARDHHGEIGLHEARKGAIDLLHRGRATDERHALDFLDGGLARRPRLRLAQRATDDRNEILQVERFREVIVSAALGRLDRGHERVLRAHHDDRQIRPQLLDARQKFESVFVGHHHVGDDKVAFARLHPPPKRGGVSGDADLVAGPG